jgi:tryptophan halogenase
MGDARLVKFRTGRHEHFWKGNVVAIGNSYGFVEPLESTGIQMILYENLGLLKHFPVRKADTECKEILNRYVAAKWDSPAPFLAIHYAFNRKYDSPFWQHCRTNTNLTGAAEPLQRYAEAAPLSYRRFTEESRRAPRPAFDEFGYDMLLIGQGVPATFVAPRETREAYLRGVRAREWLAASTLSHAQSLEVLRNGAPELLTRHIEDEGGWVAAFEKDLWQRS